MKPEEINAKIEIPDDRKFVSIKEAEAAFLYRFIQEHRLVKTLETGLGFGRSAAHILAAHGNEHMAIDPFQSDYDYLALKNIESLGFKDRFEFIEDHSHQVLPYLLREVEDRGKFDFIFIDGDHKFDGILVDFYYSDLLLKTNGYIAFHDTWMRSTQLVAEFIRTNKPNYQEVESPMRNFLIFCKTDRDDGRDGMYFKEFYTRRSKAKFALITWMTTGGDTALKRIARKMKDVFK